MRHNFHDHRLNQFDLSERRMIHFAMQGFGEYLKHNNASYEDYFMTDVGFDDHKMKDLNLYIAALDTQTGNQPSATGTWVDLSSPPEGESPTVTQSPITIDTLRSFLSTKDPGTFTEVEREIEKRVSILDSQSSSQNERSESEKVLTILISYLESRRGVLSQTTQSLQHAKKEVSDMPDAVETIWSKSKELLGDFAEGFKNSDGAGKLVMIAGVAITAIAAKIAYKKLNETKGGKAVITTGWIGLGGVLVYSGLQAVNKTHEKMYGKPILNLSDDSLGFRPTKEEWNASKSREQLDAAWKDLQETSIPASEFVDFVSSPDDQKKYAFGLTNMMLLTTDELLGLYNEGLSGNQIAESVAPKHPFENDMLTETERFNLVQEILESLGFVDVMSRSVIDSNVKDEYRNMRISDIALMEL